jgi:hypothetical protein
MLWLSENDLKNFIGGVIRNVAKNLGIQGWERLPYYNLVKKIKTKKPLVSTKLEAFFLAYKRWHDYQIKLNLEKQGGELSVEEQGKLQRFISVRDVARDALMNELHKK